MIGLNVGEQIKFMEPTMIQIGDVHYIGVLKVMFQDKDPIIEKNELVIFSMGTLVTAFHYVDNDGIDVGLVFQEDGQGGLTSNEIEFIIQKIPEEQRMNRSLLDQANERFEEL